MTRLVVGLVALGASFLGASAAQGSIGTGNQVTTSLPDIRTATIIPTFNEVEVCFDGPVTVVGGAGSIQVGGYISNSFVAGGSPDVSSTDGRCVQAQFAGTVDLPTFTYAHVNAGTVRNNVGSLQNIADAAPLIGSTTKNGTRGNSAGPDLIIAAANVGGTSNQIGYRFDQAIDLTAGSGACAAPGPTNPSTRFQYYDNNGFIHNNGAVISCSNTTLADGSKQGNVLVAFPPASSPVENARRAYATDGAVRTPITFIGNRLFSVVVVGGGGTNSNDPDLVAAELTNPDGSTNSLDFTFDESVTNASATRFHAILSDGSAFDGTGTPTLLDSAQGSNTRVRVQFGTTFNLGTEFVVGGYIDCFSTDASPPTLESGSTECSGTPPAFSAQDGQKVPPNGLPAGDNANAFALGWTTGPDPVSASKTVGERTVLVRVDQRLIVGDSAQLVDTSGLTGVFCTPNALSLPTAPDQQNVTFQCPSGSDLGTAVGLYMPGTPGGGPTMISTLGYPNVDQIVGIG